MKKINYKAIESFSNRITEAVSYNFYLSHKKASGKDVLTVSAVKQFNLFVLKNIFLEWQSETEKYKSDYFDFENDEVKQALKDFMKTVSFHISLGQDAFSALFHDAVLDTFSLVLQPEKYFKNLVKELKTIEKLKENQRYFIYNKHVIENILKVWEEKQNSDDVINEMENILKESGKLYAPKDFMVDVSQIIPTNTDDFILEDNLETKMENTTAPKPVEVKETATAEEAAPVAEQEAIPEEEARETESIIEEEPESNVEVTEEEPVDADSKVTGDNPVATEEVKTELINSTEKPAGKTYNDLFAPETTKKTLYDELKTKSNDSKHFRDCITLSQKYIFIKELFGGSMDVYDNAVSEVDKHHSYEEASNFLIYNYADKYNWQKKEEQSAELFEALSLKF